MTRILSVSTWMLEHSLHAAIKMWYHWALGRNVTNKNLDVTISSKINYKCLFCSFTLRERVDAVANNRDITSVVHRNSAHTNHRWLINSKGDSGKIQKKIVLWRTILLPPGRETVAKNRVSGAGGGNQVVWGWEHVNAMIN